MFKNVQITTAKTQFHTFPTKHKHDVSENLASLAYIYIYLKLYIYRLHMESLYFTYFSTFFFTSTVQATPLGSTWPPEWRLWDRMPPFGRRICWIRGFDRGETMNFPRDSPWDFHGKYMGKPTCYNQKMVATVKLSPVGSWLVPGLYYPTYIGD